MKRARFLWITDPWDTLDHSRDTSLRLAEECLAQGHEAYWCDVHSIRWETGAVRLDARKILSVAPGRASAGFRRAPSRAMKPADFTSLQYRTDPPIDLTYLHPLQLLVLGLEQSAVKTSRIVNPAPVLFMANEKLEGALLGSLMPATVAATKWETLEAFGIKEKKTVLKPLFEAQSKGIELLDWSTPSGRKKAFTSIQAASGRFSRPILLQRYLPGISEGEVRLWFLDGKLLAHVRKLPLPDDFRVNMDRGSRVVPATLTAKEKNAALRIGKALRARKIRLAAVDLIEAKVTDFNFTSPGLITQMEAVLDKNLARPIVNALANGD